MDKELQVVLKASHLRWLKEAVDNAESWRGSIIGGPDYLVQKFDKRICKMREALKIVKQMNAQKSTKL